MEPAELDQRLSRIATLWTVVFQAHGPAADAAEAARNRLMLRYSGAAYRYLLGAVRDPEAAGELCQEFAVRFLRGDFRRADPQRGRFRDYVKTALVNLVNDHHRSVRERPQGFAAGAPEPAAPAEPDLPSDQDFLNSWRLELLNQTWAALADANPAYHAVLLLRVESPELPSPEVADRVGEKLGKPMTPENVRKVLQRAHAKFAELLVERVAESLIEPTVQELEAELRVLDLLKYCRSALKRRRNDL
jgi:RNA polymerase sigma-70 factor (ECF subfamily)